MNEPKSLQEAQPEKPKKSFSERYFESLDKMEKTLGEAREVLRSVDLYQFLQNERDEREKLRERVLALEREGVGMRKEIKELKGLADGKCKGSGTQG